MKPIFLIDCDGPLARFADAYLDALHAVTGARHFAYEIDRWDIGGCAFFAAAASAAGYGDVKALEREIHAMVERPGFCDGILVQPGAQEAIAELKGLGEVFVVTAPWVSSPTWAHERTRWLEKHFALAPGHVLHAQRKHLIRGDLFVDDKASHIEEWLRAWPVAQAILYDMPHNQAEGAGLRRGNWGDALALAREIF